MFKNAIFSVFAVGNMIIIYHIFRKNTVFLAVLTVAAQTFGAAFSAPAVIGFIRSAARTRNAKNNAKIAK